MIVQGSFDIRGRTPHGDLSCAVRMIRGVPRKSGSSHYRAHHDPTGELLAEAKAFFQDCEDGLVQADVSRIEEHDSGPSAERLSRAAM